MSLVSYFHDLTVGSLGNMDGHETCTALISAQASGTNSDVNGPTVRIV
jgi:hypothetical protein